MIRDFRPSASLSMLQHRAAILGKIRTFFETRGFLEVETPALSADTVVDRHLDPFFVSSGGKRFFLQTSPEFAMKRILQAYRVPIFQICKVFRQDECGTLHNPEFTMLEYYKPGDDYDAGMQLLDDFQETILQNGSALRLSYREAFMQGLGVDPFRASVAELAELAQEHEMILPVGFDVSPDANRDDWLDFLLGEKIQPLLGVERPTILYNFPATQAALAQTRGETAERFELYVRGIELANGYHELLDPKELRRRNNIANALRRMDGKDILPDDSRLLSAMEAGLPPCSGVAIGVDRLIMVALEQSELASVLAFPFGVA
ncbi:MAG: EF-P lysine aminoacylase EpmA [Planctomycetia bacterium]|nr:EF-P lysine aminoacylase EpmA [Planctomycetia bacterium]